MKKILIFLFSVLTFQFAFAEYTVESVPNPKTTDRTAFVSNPDGIIGAETVAKINSQLNALESTNGVEVAVVLLNSIGNDDIENFANNLFKKWGIGKAKQNNGLLILFVLDQRKIKFETGYGLEGVLPDAIAKRIQSRFMIPEFKNGNYDAGMLNGVTQVAGVVKGESFDEKPVKIAWNEIIPVAIGIYLIIVLLSFVWIQSVISKIRKDTEYKSNIARYKAIKSQKTGIQITLSLVLPVIGFAAVILFNLPLYLIILLFGIPLSTIPAGIFAKVMMHKIRREPIQCSECGGQMHILSEKEEDEHLKLAQQFEEQLHAIDYDVFVCDTCKNEAIYTLDKPSIYSKCPKCGTKAFIFKDKKTIVAPTYISSGRSKTTFHCKYCGYEEHHNDNIPRLQRNGGAFVGGAVAGSILSSGRGGFGGGGGGFSGGGSFGGGMSGGGGATSSW